MLEAIGNELDGVCGKWLPVAMGQGKDICKSNGRGGQPLPKKPGNAWGLEIPIDEQNTLLTCSARESLGQGQSVQSAPNSAFERMQCYYRWKVAREHRWRGRGSGRRPEEPWSAQTRYERRSERLFLCFFKGNTKKARIF